MNSLAERTSLARRVVAHQRQEEEAFVDFLSRLVRFESPSFVVERQHLILDFLEGQFAALGFSTRRVRGPRSGGHLLAYPKEREKATPYQLLLGHCDTVWPVGTLAQMPLMMEDGWLQGPGVYDMKAGLTQIWFALKTLRELAQVPSLTPVVFINSDEEVGSFESARYLRWLARGAARAFVLEPSLGADGRLKTARKGVGGFQVTITGQAAHAGLEPERGASAILELSHVIQKLFALNDLERGTTVNVGTVEGGSRPNVIAAESRARVDVRAMSQGEAERVERLIREIEASTPGVKIEMEGGFGRPPLERTPRNRALWRLAQRAASDLELELQEGVAGGGSDGNITSPFTATLDGLGAVGRGAHAKDEAIRLEQTLERAALLTLLILSPQGGNE